MHRDFADFIEQFNPFLARTSTLVLLLLVLTVWALPAVAGTFSAKVVSVTDGDTLTVMHDGAREKVILFGVDCPELAQEFGPQAKKFTDDCCYGKVVSLEEHGRDPRGRTIAVVRLPDGSNLNQELVHQGLAWWSDKFAPDDAQLQQLHNTAKTAHAGLWSAPNPIPPWIFRNGEKGVQATIMPK
jgi:micrococcal nuclease